MKEDMAHPERTERQLKIESLEREISDLDLQAQRASSPATYDWLTHRIDRLAVENLKLRQQEEQDRENEVRISARESEDLRQRRSHLGRGPWITALLCILIGIGIGSLATIILGVILAPLVIAWTKGKNQMEEVRETPHPPQRY